MAFATVLVGWRWVRLVTPNVTTQLLFLVLATNTMMFTGLSASVNYDNLTNLLAAAAVYGLFRTLLSGSGSGLLHLVAIVLAGCLTKTSFLPLAMILFLALAFNERAHLGDLKSLPRWRPRSRGEALTLALVVLLLAANLGLYGGNLVRYQRLAPGLEQLVGPDLARKNRIVARNALLQAYREGEIELREALEMTEEIEHPPDRRSTRALLQMTRRAGDQRLELPRWSPIWGRFILQRTYGYFGHRVLLKKPLERNLYAGVLGAALLLFLTRWRSPAHTRLLRLAAFISGSYIAVIMLAVNRVTYLEYGLADLAVQGRYLFPILVPLYGLVACSLVDLVPRRLQLPIAVLVTGYFVYGDLPYFLAHTTPEWFGR